MRLQEVAFIQVFPSKKRDFYFRFHSCSCNQLRPLKKYWQLTKKSLRGFEPVYSCTIQVQTGSVNALCSQYYHKYVIRGFEPLTVRAVVHAHPPHQPILAIILCIFFAGRFVLPSRTECSIHFTPLIGLFSHSQALSAFFAQILPKNGSLTLGLDFCGRLCPNFYSRWKC